MATFACDCCHRNQAPCVALAQDHGDGTLAVCLRCLHSSLLMKAAASEQRGSRLLRQHAEEYGLQVWCSGQAVYLMPAVAPFAQPLLVPAHQA